jgi:protein gp37
LKRDVELGKPATQGQRHCPACGEGCTLLQGRRRVFCASMADVFDKDAPVGELARLWHLIAATPNLDWLLLTKRPQVAWKYFEPYRIKGPPSNVWLGTTVEDQKMADLRIPRLLSIPATVHFLSCEPLLGPVDLSRWLDRTTAGRFHAEPIVDWVIAGGESGAFSRDSDPDWFRSLRDQCEAAGAAFHFKQWGRQAPGAVLDGREHREFPSSKGTPS